MFGPLRQEDSPFRGGFKHGCFGNNTQERKWSYLKWQSVVLAANFTDVHFMIDVCMSGTEKYLD